MGTFPVVVPQAVPPKNIWFISLCRSRECERPQDADVSVNFPIAGFNLYEVSPDHGSHASSAKRSPRISVAVFLALAVLSWSTVGSCPAPSPTRWHCRTGSPDTL